MAADYKDDWLRNTKQNKKTFRTIHTNAKGKNFIQLNRCTHKSLR